MRYIKERFASRNKEISDELCLKICEVTENYSSYVQQLAWNVFAETHTRATSQSFEDGLATLFEQCTALFQQQIANLSSYQMNMLRAISQGVHTSFSSQKTLQRFNLGSKSNISRLCSSLIDKELIERRPDGFFMTDPIFARWFART